MRRRKNNVTLTTIQDPGKDLFAYLFLLIMVFSFMLLMSSEQRENRSAPERSAGTTSSTFNTVASEQLGRLVKNEKGIFLAFDGSLYNPACDLDKLNSDNRIVQEAGAPVLYLLEEKGSTVLLGEYLGAFQQLGSQGVRVTFAKRL